MQKQSIPPYKPSAHIAQQFPQPKNTQRRKTAIIPKRSWVYRYPKTFQFTAITASLLVLFSKPLYDAFIAEAIVPNKDIDQKRIITAIRS